MMAGSVSLASAQTPDRSSDAPLQRGVGAGGNRAGLELQLRQKFFQRARSELALDSGQMAKLLDVNRRFVPQQRALDQREMQTRQALRQALMETPSADQDRRVGDLHEQLVQFQRQRFDLSETEQKELRGFMTNVQRVRFQALQENFRRQLQDGLTSSAGRGRRGRPPL
jgi:hypothetical protein